MNNTDKLVREIIKRFRKKGYSQPEGYNRFGYVRETGNAVFVSGKAGKDTRIPFKKIQKALDAVREDPDVYSKGPGSLRKHGITHINSPKWSLLNFLTLDEIIEEKADKKQKDTNRKVKKLIQWLKDLFKKIIKRPDEKQTKLTEKGVRIPDVRHSHWDEAIKE